MGRAMCPASGEPPTDDLRLHGRRLYGWCVICRRYVRVTKGRLWKSREVFFRHKRKWAPSTAAFRISRFIERLRADQDRQTSKTRVE